MIEKTTKKDVLLVVLVLFIAAIFLFWHHISEKEGEKQVIIKVGREIEARLDLDKDQEYVINGGSNKLRIEDGKAYMIEADCPDHICISQGQISSGHESIICLPNEVVVEILESSNEDFDVIAK